MPDHAAEHTWVIAATVEVSPAQARHAFYRGSVRFPERMRIDALETYCHLCRRPWDDVADEPCVAVADNTHLRGGPVGVRKKRKQFRHEHDCSRWGCEHDCAALGCPTTGGATRRIPMVG